MSALALSADVTSFLQARGADRDDAGFLVFGPEAPISYMGAGDELVLADSLRYTVGGQPFPLASDLLAAGFGVGVTVVGEAPTV